MTAQLSRERLEEIASLQLKTTSWGLEHAPEAYSTVYSHEIVEMARMLLAGMSAKSRKLFTCTGCGAEGLDEPLESKCHCNEDGAHWAESVVFTAPPAPVAVPDECPRSIIDDAEEFDSAEEMARTIWTACRAAMFKEDK